MGSGKFTAHSGDEPRSGRHSAASSRPPTKSGSSGKAGKTEDDLITRLRGLPRGPSPDLRFTNELRSQLVSIAPRIVAESATDQAGARADRRPVRVGLLRTVRRPLIAVAGGAAVLTMLLSLAVWISHGALPGQSLYGVKRASENFQLSLASGDAGKAKDYLDQATRRATETTKLVRLPAGSPPPVSGHLASLLASTLNSADADTRSGISLLGKLAVAQSSASPLTGISSWVSAQHGRLADLQSRLPDGSARNRAGQSLALLQRVASRLTSWQVALDCRCQAVSHSDDLGPQPSGPVPSPTGLPPLPTGSASKLPSPTLPTLGGSPSPTGS